MPKTVVLLSGGLDSTTTLAIVKAVGLRGRYSFAKHCVS